LRWPVRSGVQLLAEDALRDRDLLAFAGDDQPRGQIGRAAVPPVKTETTVTITRTRVPSRPE
jgi:hypothetical protein